MKANRDRCQLGMSLLETMLAVAILLVALAAIMSLFTVAVTQNANQGEFATRTTEYAQDKMEQLLALAYDDASTNTTVYPPSTSPPGTGLAGTFLAVGNGIGSINPNSPANGFVDYLDAAGNLLTVASSSNWFYKRQWRIDQIATGIKKVSVIAVVRRQAGLGPLPSTTLASLKTNVP